MTDFYVHIEGHAVTAARIHVPRVGVWWADLDMADDSEIPSGNLTVGSVVLKGTIVASRAGTFGLQRRLRIVGGANGWSSQIDRRAHHNDVGVAAAEVAQAAADDCGETLGTAPSNRLPGVDYVRDAGVAAKTLEDVARGTDWFVDFDGITHVQARSGTAANPDRYQVLHFNPRAQEAELVVQEISDVLPGMTIQGGQLDAPEVVSSLEIRISHEGIRVIAWTGDDTKSHILDAIESLVKRAMDRKLFGKYRYRVVGMAGDRVNVAALREQDGLPNLLSITMNAAPGIHAILAEGANVFVEFEAGDRDLPMITAFAGKNVQGHVPQELDIGGNDTSIARVGDLTQAGGPGLVVTLTPVGTGIGAPPNNAVVAGLPMFLSFSPIAPLDVIAGTDCQPLYGAILNGSPLVKTKAG